MITVIALLILLLVTALMVLVDRLGTLRYRIRSNRYRTHDESARHLIADVQASRKRVLILCRSCKLGLVSQDLRDNLIAELRQAHARNVHIEVICEDDHGHRLLELARDGILVLTQVPRVPLYVRLIDDNILRTRFEAPVTVTPGVQGELTMAPYGFWLSTTRADQALVREVEKLRASLAPSVEDQPAAA